MSDPITARVNLSLRRVPAELREKLPRLGAFQRVAHLAAIAQVLGTDHDTTLKLGQYLVAVGLADVDDPYLLLDQALTTVLRAELSPDELVAAEREWFEATLGLAAYLYNERLLDPHIAAHGAAVALPELLAALDHVGGEASAGTDPNDLLRYLLHLETLVEPPGRPSIQARIDAARQRILEPT